MRQPECSNCARANAVLLAVLAAVTSVDGGCYQQRLCCSGSNSSCLALDDGLEHVPLRPILQMSVPQVESPPTANPDDSNLKFPSVVSQTEGSGSDDAVTSQGGDRWTESFAGSEPLQLVEISSTGASAFRRIIFGEAFFPTEQPPDVTRYLGPNKLIRNRRSDFAILTLKGQDQYSLLNQHMPMRIVNWPSRSFRAPRDSKSKMSNLVYLGVTHDDAVCYCDDVCVTFEDCCSDYTFTCPPSDCVVTAWSEWSTCETNSNSGQCGSGISQRTREVSRDVRHGGVQCPPLAEQKACFKDCSAAEDLTTVALLLSYDFSQTRRKLERNNIYWDLPEVANKLATLSYYCVLYEVGWVNHNCVDKKLTTMLRTGNKICAECQPEAQMHRQTLRCASDLNDGEYGFWKLIGPKSCNGIWMRISRIDNCTCDTMSPKMDSFLLV